MTLYFIFANSGLSFANSGLSKAPEYFRNKLPGEPKVEN